MYIKKLLIYFKYNEQNNEEPKFKETASELQSKIEIVTKPELLIRFAEISSSEDQINC